jgi:CheY-like chemotaxis protein
MNIPEKDNEIVIKTDAYRFKQVMINLISNALKFTEKGTVEFGYIIEKQDAGHSTQEKFIRFYVKDTGIGIPKDSLLEIFERFKKLEDKRTKLYRGAGLGLAISKNLVELMGGSIWAESEEGKGATFSFSLPYQSLEIKEEKKPKENNGDSKYIWEDKTILVVEDEDFVCKFYGRILGPTKATVIWANNGLQAVEACRSNDKINVVLMDMKLPEISGYEATRRIKTFRKHLPIIAQTAYAMSEDRSLCLEAGCDDYITKPIDPLILLNKIHNALNHGRGN